MLTEEQFEELLGIFSTDVRRCLYTPFGQFVKQYLEYDDTLKTQGVSVSKRIEFMEEMIRLMETQYDENLGIFRIE
jgi:hypothetical protein